MPELNYAPVSGSLAASVGTNPPAGYRGRASRVRIGEGDERWVFAVAETLTWGIKRRAGFRVSDESVAVGDDVTLRFGIAGLGIREPVRVVAIVDEPNRRGFSYGTLPGHPIRGEESFVVERDELGGVWLVLRSFSRPATGAWALAYPLLLIAQRVFVRRYEHVLAGSIAAATHA